MGRGITIMHIYSGQLKYLWLSLPPLPEQRAIVRYLDYVGPAHPAVRQRQAEAHSAAGRRKAGRRQTGPSPAALTPTSNSKPSGVEWLGDVPEHWEVQRAKFFFREADETINHWHRGVDVGIPHHGCDSTKEVRHHVFWPSQIWATSCVGQETS